MGRKRENWEENGKLAGSLPLRTGRAGYGPGGGPPLFILHNQQKTGSEMDIMTFMY